MISLIATKLRKILTMRKAIVAFVISIIFIAVPLVDAFAQDQSTLGKIGQTIVELPARTALLIIGAIIASYVNLIGLLALQMIHLLLKLASFNNFIGHRSIHYFKY